MIVGLSKKAIKELETYKDNYDQPINLSNIDSYTFDDLKTMVGNIKRTDLFTYEGENDGPTRTRKAILD